MTRRRPDVGADGHDSALRLLPPVLVPLCAEQERQAVDALAGLLAALLARQGRSDALGEAGTGPAADVPNDDEAA